MPDPRRVKFFMKQDTPQVTSREFQDMLEEVFCTSREELSRHSGDFTFPGGYIDYGLWIYCTLGQFGLFILRRNELGFQNMVRELHAEIVRPPLPVLDVSARARI